MQSTHVCTLWSRVHVAVNVLYVTLPYANRCVHCRIVQNSAVYSVLHTCVPSESVCMLLLMFSMLPFRTQTGVPIAGECSVYLLTEQAVFVQPPPLQVREAHWLIEVAAPPQNAETFGTSTSLRSHPGSTLLKSQFYLFIVYRQSSCPHLHYGSISSSFCSPRPDCFITGWAFSSSLFHWIVSLDSWFFLSLQYHFFRAGSHHHLIFPNFLLIG